MVKIYVLQIDSYLLILIEENLKILLAAQRR